MTTMQFFTRKTVVALCVTGVCTLASAKLPAPSPEAATKAAEAAAKAAWAGKVDNFKLCLSQDKVAAHYRKTTPSAKPATATGSASLTRRQQPNRPRQPVHIRHLAQPAALPARRCLPLRLHRPPSPDTRAPAPGIKPRSLVGRGFFIGLCCAKSMIEPRLARRYITGLPQ